MKHGELSSMTRRELLQSASLTAAVVGLGPMAMAGQDKTGAAQKAGVTNRAGTAGKSGAFPEKFLWGCATAAYQVEGNNTNTDLWLMEYLPGTIFKEPSGDACDHYHLYPQDISMVADLGFNTYRFSIEWSRIEPEEGSFSNAELDHYRRMLGTCHEQGLIPMVTYSHFALPRWFALKGGWERADAADRFARYCERATRHLGDLIGYASTLNEPDLPLLLNWIQVPGAAGDASVSDRMRGARERVRKESNAPEFSNFFTGDAKRNQDGLLAAHAKGMAAMKAVRPAMPVGFNLAMQDDQPASQDSHLEEKRSAVYGSWLQAAKHCDYLGVQTYGRSVVGKKDLPPPAGVELTQAGMEFYPECVEHVVRYASKSTGVPVIVTENGIGTSDDTRRVEYVQRAVAGLKRAIDDGVDVRGYVAWSLMDNFEWMSGYEPKFGLVAVDRKTQKRTIKPSGAMLGNMARRNSL